MGVRNYLIEGVSGAGKTTVAEELERRGHHVIHGDRTLARHGEPRTGEALPWPAPGPAADRIRWGHEHWIWDVAKVTALAADHSHPRTFFCGGSRNHRDFLHLFDQVFVLHLDADTLARRLAARPSGEFGAHPDEQRLITHLHATGEDLPKPAVPLDATAPVSSLVDAILARCGAADDALH